MAHVIMEKNMEKKSRKRVTKTKKSLFKFCRTFGIFGTFETFGAFVAFVTFVTFAEL